MENRFSPETMALITGLRQVAISHDPDSEKLKEAWKNYVEIKEKILVPTPFNRIELSHIKSILEILNLGGTTEHNSTTSLACFELRMDLGLMHGPGLIGELTEEDKDAVKTFAEKMSDVLIRPQ